MKRTRHICRKAVWMKVTNDRYRLPIAVADNAFELARICGTTADVIYSSWYRRKGSYIRVELEEEEGGIKQ